LCRVSLDFEGLRRSIVASQKVLALKNVFGIGKEEQDGEQVLAMQT
jgi:hypothetical protein